MAALVRMDVHGCVLEFPFMLLHHHVISVLNEARIHTDSSRPAKVFPDIRIPEHAQIKRRSCKPVVQVGDIGQDDFPRSLEEVLADFIRRRHAYMVMRGLVFIGVLMGDLGYKFHPFHETGDPFHVDRDTETAEELRPEGPLSGYHTAPGDDDPVHLFHDIPVKQFLLPQLALFCGTLPALPRVIPGPEYTKHPQA